MEKNDLGKKSEDCSVCGESLIANEDKGVYCQCYESLLKDLRTKASVRCWRLGDKVDRLKERPKDRTHETEKVRKRLKDFGLEEYAVELVILRCIEGATMREVKEEQAWSSESAARHHLKKTLKILRDGGFKL